MLEIDILTIFPELFPNFLETAFVGSPREQGAAAVTVHDLRDWAEDRHRSVDDSPYGGGPGMVMTPAPLVPAIEALAGEKGPSRRRSSRLPVAPGPAADPSQKLAELAGSGATTALSSVRPL